MKEIKLQDIALRAGVSPSTVTRVVRENGYVSQEKRRLVENAMREMGYTADSRKSGAPKGVPQVLMFQSGGQNPLFSHIAEQTALSLQAVGWQMAPAYIDASVTVGDIVRTIEKARRQNLKGVVFNCVGDNKDFMPYRHYLSSPPVPMVMIERSPDIYGLNKVMLHSKEMLFIAVRRLAHSGHRRIVFLGVENDKKDVERMRKEGFFSGVTAMGISDEAVFLPIGQYEAEDGKNAMEAYCAAHPMPTAVIASDQVMVGVSAWLYERNIRVPEQMSLVGLDDTLAEFITPPVTSVAFPVPEIVQNTVRILTEAQGGGTLPQNILLSTKLVERKSVAAPRQES